ncbi:MAG: Na+/H+ antiporter NhaC family protein [Emcibacteraceae bacterium]|nr:Na+/H+ antiporter NhaC family protein [Emcibacteraceae bacterium]
MSDYGILSILPPALSIVLAVLTRNIMLSLTAGAFSGAMILANFNPFFAIAELVEKYIFIQITSGSNAQIIVIMFAIGGFIHLLEKSGGASAFSSVVAKFVSSPARAQLAAWCAGVSVFFTDSGNALIVGPLFRPIFKRLNICREKLAYIIDTTASPVSILVPFISWGIYIMNLIENTYDDVGIEAEPYQVLLSVWPYQFYAFLALLSIPMFLSTGKDYGLMARAQANFNKELKTTDLSEVDVSSLSVEDSKSTLSTVLLPLGVLFVTMAVYMGYFVVTEGVQSIHMRGGILTAYIFASIACAYLMKKQRKYAYEQSFQEYVKGMQNLVFLCLIMVLAWSLSSICKDLRTGYYLAAIIGDSISPSFIPPIVFMLGATMSFATGSSYGTFAILLIIVIPVAYTLNAPLELTIAAVLSGGLFGDHTSPISDTTVLASMGADCPHIDHVTTQFSYAIIPGGITLLTFLISAYYPSPYIIFAVILIQLMTIKSIMWLFGKTIDN